MELGEAMEFIPFQSESRADRFDAKLRLGVWLGLDSRTDENLIGTKHGVFRAATAKGLPEDQRWDAARAPTRQPPAAPHGSTRGSTCTCLTLWP